MQPSKHYKVDYLLNFFTQKEGHIVSETEEIRQHESDTDDMRYLFTDLLELHRLENLKGIKIIKVEEC